MAYATASELRTRYLQGADLVDEFVTLEDADLTRALESASQEIDSYIPSVVITPRHLDILKDKCLTLGRMLAYTGQALDDTTPIVRDALSVRSWLVLWSTGKIVIPDEVSTVLPGESIPVRTAVSQRSIVFDDTFIRGYTL